MLLFSHVNWTSRHVQVARNSHIKRPEVGKHVNAVTSRIASCLHFLKQLKRSGAGSNDLLCFYNTVVRPVLEYVSPVWHSSLTVGQSEALESMQKRAMRIIFPNLDYNGSLFIAHKTAARSTYPPIFQAQRSARVILPTPLTAGKTCSRSHQSTASTKQLRTLCDTNWKIYEIIPSVLCQ